MNWQKNKCFLTHKIQQESIKSLLSILFYNRSTVLAQLKKLCEIIVMLASCAPFLQVLSVVKFLTAYNRCSLRPRVFQLDYNLGLGSLSLLVFVRCPQLLQNQRYSGNTIGHW